MHITQLLVVALLFRVRAEEKIAYRELELEDYDNGLFETLALLTDAPKVPWEVFKDAFNMRKQMGTISLVAVDENNKGRIIGTVSLVFERKFIRGCASKGHLEDLAVQVAYRNNKIGQTLVNKITEMGWDRDFYKTSLQCIPKIQALYDSCGYKKVEMALSIYRVKEENPDVKAQPGLAQALHSE